MDLIALDDIDAAASEVTDPLAELAQDLYRRLIEYPGSNIDDPDRGLGLSSVLSSTVDVPALRARIIAELRKDERVLTVAVVVTQVTASQAGDAWTADIAIEADEGALGVSLAVDGSGRVRRT